jgi:tetratricopeptide (TPR) repeat protein
MILKDYKFGLLLLTIAVLSICIFPLAHKTIYGQVSDNMVYVAPEEMLFAVTEATGMRSEYSRESAPESAILYYETGRSYLKLKKYSAALIRFDRAIELDPQFAEVYYLRARTYLKLEKPYMALVDFNRSIELRPEDKRLMGGSLYSRGLLLFDMERYEEAVDDFTHAIELLPEYAIIQIKRGETYVKLKELIKAVRDLESAIEIKPELAPVLEPRIQELNNSLEN